MPVVSAKRESPSHYEPYQLKLIAFSFTRSGFRLSSGAKVAKPPIEGTEKGETDTPRSLFHPTFSSLSQVSSLVRHDRVVRPDETHFVLVVVLESTAPPSSSVVRRLGVGPQTYVPTVSARDLSCDASTPGCVCVCVCVCHAVFTERRGTSS